MPPRVLVVGSINMDLIVRCRQMPRPGETVLGQDFHTAPGGKGANQAVACARLGAETTMVGRVGEDDFGRSLLAGLAADGVKVEPVQVTSGVASGVALIVLEEEGDNRIVVASGANAMIGAEDAARAEALLDRCDVVLMQLEVPLAVVKRVAAAAKARDVRVVLDAGAATRDAADSHLFASLDVLSPNEAETEVLTGLSVRTLEEARLAARALWEMGAAQVVLKLGSRGALWFRAGVERHVPAFSIDPVDTTAAGDAFTAGLAVALASGEGMDECLRRASAAGALACLTLGAQPSMPTRAQVDVFLATR